MVRFLNLLLEIDLIKVVDSIKKLDKWLDSLIGYRNLT